MSEIRTYQEWKADYVVAMGKELGELMAFFWNEMNHLNRCWQNYLTIFDSEANLKIANETCPSFFWHYQYMFREHFVISIVRLIEVNTRGQASLHKLKELVDHEECKAKVYELLDELKFLSKNIIETRSNYYAHYSYKKKILSRSEKLKGTSKNDIEIVLKKMSDVVNVVVMHYMDSSTPFFELQDGYGANGLIVRLAQSDLFEKLNYNRKLNKQITPEMWDWQARI